MRDIDKARAHVEQDSVRGKAVRHLEQELREVKVRLAYTPGGDAMSYGELAKAFGDVCAERDRYKADSERLREALNIPRVIAYPTKDGGREMRLDECLNRWLEFCGYHEGLVYQAIIDWIALIDDRRDKPAGGGDE